MQFRVLMTLWAAAIVAILECLGLESSPPPISPARAPPQFEFS